MGLSLPVVGSLSCPLPRVEQLALSASFFQARSGSRSLLHTFFLFVVWNFGRSQTRSRTWAICTLHTAHISSLPPLLERKWSWYSPGQQSLRWTVHLVFVAAAMVSC